MVRVIVRVPLRPSLAACASYYTVYREPNRTPYVLSTMAASKKRAPKKKKALHDTKRSDADKKIDAKYFTKYNMYFWLAFFMLCVFPILFLTPAYVEVSLCTQVEVGPGTRRAAGLP